MIKISKNNENAGVVINCAIRYCLGRHTYAPSVVINEITPILNDLSARTLQVIERDVSEWLENDSGNCPDYIVEDWRHFLEKVKEANE